jgi:hypothetical protein
MANDNSLLIALAELRDIEAQRIAGEGAAEAKDKKDAGEAIAQKAAFAAEERAERKAVAEAKARLSLEAEAKSSVEAEASKARLAALQAQLHSIQAERRVLHEPLLPVLPGLLRLPHRPRSPWRLEPGSSFVAPKFKYVKCLFPSSLRSLLSNCRSRRRT